MSSSDVRGGRTTVGLLLMGGSVILGSIFLGLDPLVGCLAMVVLAALLDWHVRRDIFSPVVLVSVMFGWLYVAKGAYARTTGLVSSGTSADAIGLTQFWSRALDDALTAAVVGFFALALGFFVTAGVSPPRAEGFVGGPQLRFDLGRFRLIAVSALCLDLAAFGFLIMRAGGLASYFGSLSLRSETLAGVAFVTLATVPLTLALLIGLAIRFNDKSGEKRPSALLLTVLTVACTGSALLTGGRAALITGVALPILLVFHYVRGRIRTLTAGVMAVASVIGFVTLGAVLRDAQFGRDSGRSLGSFVSERFNDLGESLVGGVEAVPLDSMTILLGSERLGLLSYQFGGTYAAIATWPIPRAVWQEKPAGGGNAWFTQEYVPRFYGEARVESSISLIGESFANFGWAGVVIVPLMVGLALGVLFRRYPVAGRHPMGIAWYAAVFGFFLAFVRGDAYHNVTSIVFVTALWFVIRLLVAQEGDEGRAWRSARPF